MSETGYLHEASGVSLYKPLAQPHAEHFFDVFPAWEPWQFNAKQGISAQWLTDSDGERMAVGPYCSWRDHYDDPKAVRCADWVLSRLRERTLIIPNDQMSFDMVSHDNGWTLVTAHHSSILSSVWLAYIRTDSIPMQKGLDFAKREAGQPVEAA